LHSYNQLQIFNVEINSSNLGEEINLKVTPSKDFSLDYIPFIENIFQEKSKFSFEEESISLLNFQLSMQYIEKKNSGCKVNILYQNQKSTLCLSEGTVTKDKLELKDVENVLKLSQCDHCNMIVSRNGKVIFQSKENPGKVEEQHIKNIYSICSFAYSRNESLGAVCGIPHIKKMSMINIAIFPINCMEDTTNCILKKMLSIMSKNI